MSESVIKVENLVKSFGDHEVLKKIDEMVKLQPASN